MTSLSRLILGAICDCDIVLHPPDQGGWIFHTYAIAPDRPSSHRFPDSAFATPARYIQELFSRLSEIDQRPSERIRFVFNPLFATTRASLLTIISALRAHKNLSGPAILVDRDGLPVGYLLPDLFSTHETRYLTLLSAVDAALDSALLKHLYFAETTVVQVSRLHLARHGRNGFDDPGTWSVYRWVTQQAISRLNAIYTSKQQQTAENNSARQQRDALPFTAIMPNHAGDVLFFALAFNQINSPYRRIAVNRAYADIVLDVAPLLNPVAIDTLAVNRNSAFATGGAIRDHDHFHAYKDTLPDDSFYTYCRPSRNYNTTNFHLIDHFAFAIGYSPRDEKALLIRSHPAPTRLSIPLSTGAPARILLHFDAGWPLKVYPTTMQSQLIELLTLRGHSVTVLAPPGYANPSVKAKTFSSLSDFVSLACAHDIIVGMDSFPSHYCVHVLGLPTLCLFANTKPVNSNALASGHYAYLEKELRCRPCYAIAHCPIYGGNDCRNFVVPQLVVEQIEKLLIGAMAPKKMEATETVMSASSPGKIHIYLNFLGLQTWAVNFIPPMSFWSSLLSEFVRAIRREGILLAVRRSIRFLIRKARMLS